MVNWAKRTIRETVTAIARIVIIFLILSIGFDATIRIYYAYMPIETWMSFQSVAVKMQDGEAVAVINRRPRSQQLSTFLRTLLIHAPDEGRGCTDSTVVIVDNPAVGEVVAPLDRLLSDTCPDVLGSKTIDAVLQVSYVFEFPYGTKRLVVRYSNHFTLKYEGGKYIVGSPPHQ